MPSYQEMDTFLLFFASLNQPNTEITYGWTDEGINHAIVATMRDDYYMVLARRKKDDEPAREEEIFVSLSLRKAAAVFMQNTTNRMLGDDY